MADQKAASSEYCLADRLVASMEHRSADPWEYLSAGHLVACSVDTKDDLLVDLWADEMAGHWAGDSADRSAATSAVSMVALSVV